MGDLEFSEVIFSIQNDLYNWGARDYFLQNLSKYVVNYTILFKQSKGESGWWKILFIFFSASYPIVDSKYLHSSQGYNIHIN